MKLDAATLAQVRAADPGASSWVSANAGSGKTKVLTDRVARLLLRGTDPMAILCLTYTKAAAAEMQNRLFKRLGEWAMLPDDVLRAQLGQLGEERHVVERADLARARTLFARALETPGGLKIQTIHSFCEQLLRRFPLEAGVSPQFEVLDERQAAQTRADLLEDLAADPDSGFAALAPHIQGQEASMDGFLQGILRHRDAFAASPDRAALEHALGVRAGQPELRAAIREAARPAQLAALRVAIAGSTKKTDAPFLAALDVLLSDTADLEAAFEAAYLTKDGDPRARLGTRDVTDAMPQAAELQKTICDLVARNRNQRLASLTADRSYALARFAHAFITAYARRKALLGRMDFDDLIDAARGLLTQSAARDWVRYRLDGGISHVLVDEAQDTSPGQWQVIDALAEEFFIGQGARDEARTIFVVGDFKQSIYSFQGADPRSFTEQRAQYAEALADIGQVLEDCALDFSFRSAAPVLDVVDAVLAAHPAHGLGEAITHHAFHNDLPGRVELWPFEEGDPGDDDPPWYEPLDQRPEGDPARKLARRIAEEVKALLDARPILPGREVPLDPADILILVRKRNKFFSETIRALKEAGVPVAGADRLKVAEQLAVKDLMSLLRFIALPEDDLSLAEALRSPIFRLSEADLFRLAHGRKGTLWAAMRNADAFAETAEMLRDIRNRADYDRPYELLERVLVRHGARQRIRARLGLEAEEAVDALLGLALDYERVEAPSLVGFIDWMSSGDPELKRQLDAQGGEVRVMTVHGAKGLEAPVVILPDTAKPRGSPGSAPLTELGPGLVALRPSKAEQPQRVKDALATEARLAEEEDWRLLYVAMTRAEQWLIVCGGGNGTNADDGWHRRVRTALDHVGAREDGSGRLVHQVGWSAMTSSPGARGEENPTIPDWLRARPPSVTGGPDPLAPSEAVEGEHGAGGAGLGQEAALRRGRQMHLLLEHLPGVAPLDRAGAARRLLSVGEDAATAEEVPDLLIEVERILGLPGLAWIFEPGSRAEVPVAGRLEALGGRGVTGIIDRLVEQEDTLWAIDYKTDFAPPTLPEAIPAPYAAQLALYGAALRQIWPEREVKLAILWTRTAELMPVPHEAVTTVLQSLAPH